MLFCNTTALLYKTCMQAELRQSYVTTLASSFVLGGLCPLHPHVCVQGRQVQAWQTWHGTLAGLCW